MRPQYLFLYPIREYFESCGLGRTAHLNETIPALMRLIDMRYRREGYSINWLLFGQESKKSASDRSKIPEELEILCGDNVISGGISFSEHVAQKKYPLCSAILSQIPEHSKLVLGGFHQNDCVDKIARVSYEMGIDTFVDEDTTELGIMSLIFKHGTIPPIRDKYTIRGFRGSKIVDDELSLKQILKCRRDKPWFVQEVG